MDQIDGLPAVPRVGDVVKVVNQGMTYSSYESWVERNTPSNLSAWKGSNFVSAVNGSAGTVLAVAPHTTDSSLLLALVKFSDRYVVIGVKGLAIIKSKDGVAWQPNFILQYDLKVDPFELFETMKEVEARIKVLASNPDLNRDTIKIYEIKNILSVKLDTRVIIGGLKVTTKPQDNQDKKAIKRAEQQTYYKKNRKKILARMKARREEKKQKVNITKIEETPNNG